MDIVRVRWHQPAQETLNRGQFKNVGYRGRSVRERGGIAHRARGEKVREDADHIMWHWSFRRVALPLGGPSGYRLRIRDRRSLKTSLTCQPLFADVS